MSLRSENQESSLADATAVGKRVRNGCEKKWTTFKYEGNSYVTIWVTFLHIGEHAAQRSRIPASLLLQIIDSVAFIILNKKKKRKKRKKRKE